MVVGFLFRLAVRQARPRNSAFELYSHASFFVFGSVAPGGRACTLMKIRTSSAVIHCACGGSLSAWRNRLNGISVFAANAIVF